ncbi:MAG: hypothetical protein JNM80_03190 [Phycisphaerae bacterium]|nr:hypothetical protein [Phycisphaerae bacterium]
MRGALGAIAAAAALVGACAPRALPTFEWRGVEAATEVLSRRAREVRTVRSECSVYLAKPDGSTLGLDGALAAAPPERMRLRTWKLGQAALDVTIRPGEVWLATPEGRGPEVGNGGEASGSWAGKFAEGWRLMAGGFFDSPAEWVEDSGGATFVLVRRLGEARVACEVDRRRLVPIAYRVLDETGVVRFTLRLEDYAVHGEASEDAGAGAGAEGAIVWPGRVVAVTPQGRVTIRMRDPEFNTELVGSVFDPPRGAVRQP